MGARRKVPVTSQDTKAFCRQTPTTSLSLPSKLENIREERTSPICVRSITSTCLGMLGMLLGMQAMIAVLARSTPSAFQERSSRLQRVYIVATYETVRTVQKVPGVDEFIFVVFAFVCHL